MIPNTFSETPMTLRVLQILTIIAPVAFFVVATIITSFSTTQTSKVGKSNLRKAQLVLTCLAALFSATESLIDLKRSDPLAVSDPDAVYALFLTLVWVILTLGLIDISGPASYPHHGAWAILLVCQGTVFALSRPVTFNQDKPLLVRDILQGSQLAVEFGLLASSFSIHFLQKKTDNGTEGETHPLLADETGADGPNQSNETKEPDEDEADRLRIRNRPFWQYVASFKIFLPYMYPRSRRLQLYFGGMCVFSALTRVIIIALPLSLGVVINSLGEAVPWRAIGIFVLLKFLLSHAGLSLVETWLSYRLNVDLVVALQRHCYNHIMNLSAEFHDSKKSSVIWTVMHQGQDVIDLLHDIIFQSLPTMIDLVSAIVVLTYLFGLYMTFIVAITVVLFYWITFKALITKRTMRRSWLDAYHDQYYQMSESTSNWSTVSQFGRILYESQKYREKGNITRSRMLLWWFYEFWTRGLRHVVPCIAFIAACSVAALQIAHGQHKVGDFVVLITYWSQLIGPLSTIAGELSRITEKLVNAEKLVVVLEKTPRIQDLPDARPFTFLEGAVQFENVSFSYDGKRQVTKDITFRAAPGKTIALVGETGGGKSTILKILFRFYDVDQGRILIDGQDIRDVKMESFRKHIAMVPQNPVVFNMSVLENVRYPDIDCTEDEAIEACKAAALHDKIMSFTHGYQEKVGERGTKLSGGELQRLAIARAILKKADILLLDEATSSVDSITEKRIQGSIRQLCAGRTAFVIAHRLSTILHADHILVIRDGQIVEAGTHETLMKQGGAYNELWRSQLRLQVEETARSRSRSRSPRKAETQVLINDLSTSGEETQTLVKSISRSSKDGFEAQKAPPANSETSGIFDNEPRSHEASHATVEARGRMHPKRLTQALGRKMSRSKSPQKGGSSESVLNPDARTFRPRRFHDGNHSTSFSGEEMSNANGIYFGNSVGGPSTQTRPATLPKNENDSKGSPEKDVGHSLDTASRLHLSTVFPLKRKWTGHGRETLDSREDHGVNGAGEIQQDADGAHSKKPEAIVDGVEQIQVGSLWGNGRRRQAASEPFPENGSEEDDPQGSSEDENVLHSAKYSRLPQILPRRAVSAFERKTGQSSGEESADSNEPRAPVNTAATSPGVLTPRSNQKALVKYPE